MAKQLVRPPPDRRTTTTTSTAGAWSRRLTCARLGWTLLDLENLAEELEVSG